MKKIILGIMATALVAGAVSFARPSEDKPAACTGASACICCSCTPDCQPGSEQCCCMEDCEK